MELVTGATGQWAGASLRRLAAEGREVRAGAPARGRRAVARRDDGARRPVERQGLAAALEGCHTAYYLVHSMEAAGDGDFAAAIAAPSLNFARAATKAGPRADRLPQRDGANRKPIPASRLTARGRADPPRRRPALDSPARVHSDRRGSSSFRVLVRLVERLRLLPLPRWRMNAPSPSTSATRSSSSPGHPTRRGPPSVRSTSAARTCSATAR